MPYEDGDRYVDGPGFARWLGEVKPIALARVIRFEEGDATSDMLSKWRTGTYPRAKVDEDTLDALLVALDLHPTMIPDALWDVPQGHLNPVLPDKCLHGHEYTPENTGRTSRGHRRCLTCDRETRRRQNSDRHARGETARAKSRVRQERALELRDEGWSWEDIAAEVGYSGAAAAYTAARAAKKRALVAA